MCRSGPPVGHHGTGETLPAGVARALLVRPLRSRPGRQFRPRPARLGHVSIPLIGLADLAKIAWPKAASFFLNGRVSD